MKIDHGEHYNVLVIFRNGFGDNEVLGAFYNTTPDIVRGLLKKKYLSIVEFEVWTSSDFVKGEKGVPDEEVQKGV